jgi:hypothetical protein
MTVGSKFALYRDAEKHPENVKPLAEAIIAKVGLIDSQLVLVDQHPATGLDQIVHAKALEVAHCYKGAELPVWLEVSDKHAAQLLNSALGRSPALSITGVDGTPEPSWAIKVAYSHRTLHATRDDGSTIFDQRLTAFRDGDPALSVLRKRLESEVRWRYIQGLENKNPRSQIAIDIRAVPVEVLERDQSQDHLPIKVAKKAPMINGSKKLMLQDQDCFMLEVRNSGHIPAFINVLDLQPDGSVSLLYPNPKFKVLIDESVRPDGQWYPIPLPYVIQISGPFGLERLKVIATSKPADFNGIADSSRNRDVKDMNPIEKLFMLTSGSRGEPASPAPTDWATGGVEIETRSRP